MSDICVNDRVSSGRQFRRRDFADVRSFAATMLRGRTIRRNCSHEDHCPRQGGTGWAHRVEDAALCHCTGCVHTPGTQTENRPLRETERKRESARETGGGWRWGGKEGKRGWRTGCAQPARKRAAAFIRGVAAVHCLSAPSRCIS